MPFWVDVLLLAVGGLVTVAVYIGVAVIINEAQQAWRCEE